MSKIQNSNFFNKNHRDALEIAKGEFHHVAALFSRKNILKFVITGLRQLGVAQGNCINLIGHERGLSVRTFIIKKR